MLSTCRRQYRKKKKLRDYADSLDAPIKPTYADPVSISDVLDIVVLKKVLLAHCLEMGNDPGSDHQLILLSLENGVQETDSIEDTLTC